MSGLEFDKVREAILAGASDGMDAWLHAQDLTARITGGWASHALAWSPDNHLLWQCCTGAPIDAAEEFARRTATGAEAIPRARVLAAPPLTVVSDEEMVSPELRAAHPFYREFCERLDIPHVGVARFPWHDQGARLVIASLRSRRAGPITAQDRRMLSALLPSWQSAFRLRLTLDAHGAKTSAEAFGGLGLAALLLNPQGRVVAMSPDGERAVSAGELVQLRQGRPVATDARSQRALSAAIAAVLSRDPRRAPEPILLRSPRRLLLAEVAALPRHGLETHRAASVMVALLEPRRAGRSHSALLQDAYGLSPAEADVALGVSAGATVAELAEARRVAVVTVRNQMKAVLAKTGCGSQAQLVRQLAELLGGIAPPPDGGGARGASAVAPAGWRRPGG